jgi:phage baseplate assembly protein W|tara:strand:+ start:1755 stop:2135 length:381 start_codon:yes stop_codon:yes gene_type:complete
MAIGYSAKLPLAYTNDDGPYLLTKDLTENTKQNFKNLVLTNPGERVMEPDFGVGFTQLLFENANEDTVEDLKERLFIQVQRYLPFVEIQAVEAGIRENTAYLRVDYLIPALSVSEVLELDINNNFG